MPHIALYRKWRPKRFSELIGQETTVTILKNQVKSKKTGHAYIFTGTRGTGKTSVAKILAKAVNCLQPEDGEPCGKCKNCVSIDQENFIDVIELDAASYNSVDDIREIRDHVKFAPTMGIRKVYIIDEAHMLTKEAHNALLKTLEEPPEYALFILATTELAKIPATIQSRCQKFDFRRINSKGIYDWIKHICIQENVSITEEAIRIISSYGDGSMRDSLSALEQVLQTGDKEITVLSVEEGLGIVLKKDSLKLIEKILEQNTASILKLVESMLERGKEVGEIVKSITETLRDLLVCTTGELSLINENDEYLDNLRGMVNRIDVTRLLVVNASFLDLGMKLSRSFNKRVLLEIELLKSAEVFNNSSVSKMEDYQSKSTNNTKSKFEDYQTKSTNETKLSNTRNKVVEQDIPKIEQSEKVKSVSEKDGEGLETADKTSDDNFEKSISKRENRSNNLDESQTEKFFQLIFDKQKHIAEPLHNSFIEINDTHLVLDDQLFSRMIIEMNADSIEKILKDVFGKEIKIKFTNKEEYIFKKQSQHSTTEAGEKEPKSSGLMQNPLKSDENNPEDNVSYSDTGEDGKIATISNDEMKINDYANQIKNDFEDLGIKINIK